MAYKALWRGHIMLIWLHTTDGMLNNNELLKHNENLLDNSVGKGNRFHKRWNREGLGCDGDYKAPNGFQHLDGASVQMRVKD